MRNQLFAVINRNPLARDRNDNLERSSFLEGGLFRQAGLFAFGLMFGPGWRLIGPIRSELSPEGKFGMRWLCRHAAKGSRRHDRAKPQIGRSHFTLASIRTLTLVRVLSTGRGRRLQTADL